MGAARDFAAEVDDLASFAGLRRAAARLEDFSPEPRDRRPQRLVAFADRKGAIFRRDRVGSRLFELGEQSLARRLLAGERGLALGDLPKLAAVFEHSVLAIPLAAGEVRLQGRQGLRRPLEICKLVGEFGAGSLGFHPQRSLFGDQAPGIAQLDFQPRYAGFQRGDAGSGVVRGGFKRQHPGARGGKRGGEAIALSFHVEQADLMRSYLRAVIAQIGIEAGNLLALGGNLVMVPSGAGFEIEDARRQPANGGGSEATFALGRRQTLLQLNDFNGVLTAQGVTFGARLALRQRGLQSRVLFREPSRPRRNCWNRQYADERGDQKSEKNKNQRFDQGRGPLRRGPRIIARPAGIWQKQAIWET